MSPTLTVREVARLARTMTWKWAAVDLFHGGAKAGILGDPGTRDKEAVLRAVARALGNEVPREYVFGLDMGLTEKDTAIFVDELGDRGSAVGLPRALGGLPYDELGVTGYGVAEATDAAAQAIGLPIVGARVAIQGFGAVGQAAAERLVELGAVITAVSTAHGAVIDREGLDIARLVELRAAHGDTASSLTVPMSTQIRRCRPTPRSMYEVGDIASGAAAAGGVLDLAGQGHDVHRLTAFHQVH